MKPSFKTLLIICCFALSYCNNASSQLYMSPRMGFSTKNPVFGITIGYLQPEDDRRVTWLVDGGMIFHMDNKNAAFFGGQAGITYHFSEWGLSPISGAYYRLRSLDDKTQNYWVFNAGMRASFRCINIDLTHMDKTTFLTIGFNGLLRRK